MAKTWTRSTDYVRVPAICSYTAGHATNWTLHEAAPEAVCAYITNTGGVTAYVSQGVTLTNGATEGARTSDEGLPLAPGQTQRIDFAKLDGVRTVGDGRGAFYTVGVNLRIHFTLL